MNEIVGSVEYSCDAFGNRVTRVEKDGSGAVVSEERFAYDDWDTAKPIPADNEEFDAVLDLDALNA